MTYPLLILEDTRVSTGPIATALDPLTESGNFIVLEDLPIGDAQRDNSLPQVDSLTLDERGLLRFYF